MGLDNMVVGSQMSRGYNQMINLTPYAILDSWRNEGINLGDGLLEWSGHA